MKKYTGLEIDSLLHRGLANLTLDELNSVMDIDPKELTDEQNEIIRHYIFAEVSKINTAMNSPLNMLLFESSPEHFISLNKNNKKKRINLIVGQYLKYELEIVSKMLKLSLNETINTLLNDRLRTIRNLPSFKEWTELIIFDEDTSNTDSTIE